MAFRINYLAVRDNEIKMCDVGVVFDSFEEAKAYGERHFGKKLFRFYGGMGELRGWDISSFVRGHQRTLRNYHE